MATGNVKFQDVPYNAVPTVQWQTEAAATAIAAGEPVKLKALGSPYVIPVATTEPIIGTTTPIIGIAKSAGTHTASADGVIDVYMPLPGIIYRCKANSTTAFDTQSEINALCGDHVVFTLSAGVYTISQSAGDGNTKGLIIVGGNPNTQEVYFMIRPAAVEGVIA